MSKTMGKNNTFYYSYLDCMLGRLTLVCNESHLTHIGWPKLQVEQNLSAKSHSSHPVLIQTKQQLEEYFCKERRSFDLPIDLAGTPFQQQAWHILKTIPYGQTISYAQQASKLGDKKKARAVGHANGKNPIPIVIPCHRVIASSGKLTGFAGGIATKQQLLALESE